MESSNNIYVASVLNNSITISADKITSNLDNVIANELKMTIGNKCGPHGYVDGDSIVILKRSIGKINSAHLNGSLSYDVSYKANICNPIEGSIIECQVVNKNKMGILAEKAPLSIVLARQHHQDNDRFEDLNIDDIINITVVGKRFELYDNQITAIGKLV